MVVGLAADGDISLPELTVDGLADGPLVIVVGSEGKGLGRLVAETCDQLVSIPMANQLESLNAGVAASVTLYAIAQARDPGVSSSGGVLTGLVLAAVCLTVAVSSRRWPSSSATAARSSWRATTRWSPRPSTGTSSLRTGPLLPDVRRPRAGPVGVDLLLGKTQSDSVEELFARYAFIASEPDVAGRQGDRRRPRHGDVGRPARRRARAWCRWRRGGCSARTGAASSSAGCGPGRARSAAYSCWRCRCSCGSPGPPTRTPRSRGGSGSRSRRSWRAVPVPEEADGIEIRNSPTTVQTQRLIQSAVDTYEKSKDFYDRAAADAAELELREPAEDETVALVVSDRHDNIGMDRVARAIGDRGGRHGRARRRRRHLDRPAVGGLQPRLARPRRSTTSTASRSRATTTTVPSSRAISTSSGWTMLDGDQRRGALGRAAARRRRPALQRARQLARRDRA